LPSSAETPSPPPERLVADGHPYDLVAVIAIEAGRTMKWAAGERRIDEFHSVSQFRHPYPLGYHLGALLAQEELRLPDTQRSLRAALSALQAAINADSTSEFQRHRVRDADLYITAHLEDFSYRPREVSQGEPTLAHAIQSLQYAGKILEAVGFDPPQSDPSGFEDADPWPA